MMAAVKSTVLFVEDDVAALQARLERFYNHPRLTARGALNAEAAMSLMDEVPVDIVVSDDRLPLIDGLQLLECAQKRHPRASRVLVSSKADKSAVRHAHSVAKVDAVVPREYDDGIEKVLVEIDARRPGRSPDGAEATSKRRHFCR
jgi:DNA-binding NtrC family response regulator